jgi:uncharacterized protein (TIGR02186 family)
MNNFEKTLVWTAVILVSPASLVAGLTAERLHPTLRLTPEVIEIGTFYSGPQVRIEGTVEDGSKPVVVIRGADVTEVFNKKGRVGPIWVNTGEVHISGVPSLFLSFSAEPVSSFLDRATIEEYQLDEAAIKRQMRVEPKAADREVIQTNYLALKTQMGSYALINDGVKMGQPAAATVPYVVDFVWPRKAPPGTYEVRLYECRDGFVVGQASAPLQVVEVGFPARIAFLAKERAYLYGAVAVMVAVLAGFGIDFLATRLFGKKRVVRH